MDANTKNQENEMVKVTLTCGRAMSSSLNFGPSDGCGRCDSNTNNQTQATCC